MKSRIEIIAGDKRENLEKRYEERKYVLERGERRLEDRRVLGKAGEMIRERIRNDAR